jgi:hypothetical protein
MRYKFYIDFTSGNGSEYVQAYPESIEPFNLKVKEQSNDIDEFFYRLEWGKISFRNNPNLYRKTNNNIYRLFAFFDDINFPLDRYVFVKYVIEDKFTAVGYFGKNDCRYDYDRKIFDVTPAILDKYTYIFENKKKEINFADWIFDEDVITVEVPNSNLVTMQDWPWPMPKLSGFERTYISPRNRVKEKDYQKRNGLYVYFDNEKPKEALYDDEYWGFGGSHLIYDMDGNTGQYADYDLAQRVEILGEKVTSDNRNNIPKEYGDWELSSFRVYEGTKTGGVFGNRWRQLYCHTQFSREEYIKIDVADSENEWGYEPPVGDGWHMRNERIKNGKPAHLWTRLPFNGGYSNSWELQDMVENPGGSSFDWNWYKYLESKLAYDNSENSFELVSGVDFRKFVEHILHSMSSELSDIEFKSTFFFNDMEDELAILKNTTGFNYANGEKNFLNYLKLFFTKDLTDQEENEVDNIPKITLDNFLNDLNKVFANTLIWFIDENSYFRIEHKRYADFKRKALNLLGNRFLNFTTEWSFDKSIMFEKFIFKQINAGYIDFTDNNITYDHIVSNNRNDDNRSESKTEYLTTDAKYCILNPGSLKSGLILLATDGNGKVYNYAGRLSRVEETNGFLAISNILHEFGEYEGVWHYGEINGEPVNFTTTIRSKLGVEIALDGRKESLFYITQLGIGMLESGKIDFQNENTRIVLKYRYNSEVNGDISAIVYQKEEDFDGADNVWADIDNYSIEN